MNKTIVSKIQKLLALSKSANEHEAKVAMLRVQELMMKHKLTMKDIESVESIKVNVAEEMTDYTYTRATWKAMLANLIADNFGCYSYDRKYYSKTICFFGRDEDVVVAKIVFSYAMDCITSEVKKIKNRYRKEGYSTAGVETTYAKGFLVGLKMAFDKQKEEHQEWGLVLVKPIEVVHAYNNIKFGKATSVKPYEDNGDSEVYNQAIQDGKRFSVSDRISKEKEEQTLLG